MKTSTLAVLSVVYWTIALLWLFMLVLGDCGVGHQGAAVGRCVAEKNRLLLISAGAAALLYGVGLWAFRRTR